MNKKMIYGAAAILAALVMFAACETEAKVKQPKLSNSTALRPIDADTDKYSLYIAGVPAVSNGEAFSDVDIEVEAINGEISLNSTQAGVGKSIVLYVVSANVSGIRFGQNAAADNTAPIDWIELSKDTTDKTKWTGEVATAHTSNNRRLFLEVTAEDKKTIRYYRYHLEYYSSIATATAINFNDEETTTTQRGTPAGSWNATDLIPGSFTFIGDGVIDTITTLSAVMGGNDLSLSYAVTSSFPPAAEPEFAAVFPGGDSGEYFWIRAVNNNFRNIYVIQATVNPPPFSVIIGGVTVSYKQMGTSHTDALDFSGDPTAMGWVLLEENQQKGASVTATTVNPADTIQVVKGTIPNVTGTTVALQDFTGATDTLAASNFSGKDFVQVRYTPTGGSAVYYSIYLRQKVNIPYIQAGAVTIADGSTDTAITEEAVWNTTPVLTINRVVMSSTSNLAQTDFKQDDPGTHATIKLLWSDDGLYYLLKVIDTTETTTPSSSQQNSDNLEFYINEAYQFGDSGTHSNAGGQYRVGSDGVVSADSPTRVTRMAYRDAAGYTIKARISWAADPATVATWNGHMIGTESRLTYSTTSGSRAAVIGWNLFHGSAFNRTGNFGIGYLTKN